MERKPAPLDHTRRGQPQPTNTKLDNACELVVAQFTILPDSPNATGYPCNGSGSRRSRWSIQELVSLLDKRVLTEAA